MQILRTRFSVDGAETRQVDYVQWRRTPKLGIDIDVVSPGELSQLEEWGMV